MPVMRLSADKRRSTLALTLAAVLGMTALSAAAIAPPAAAQQGPVVTKQMAKPLNEARAALQAKDFATAKAKLDAAAGFAKTPQDTLALEQLRYFVAEGLKDAPGKIKAIEAVLATNLLSPEDAKPYKASLAAAWLEAGDQAKSLAAFRAYIDQYGGTHAQYAGLANDALKAQDHAIAATYAEKAVAAAKAEGGKPPEVYYKIAMRAHLAAKAMDKYYEVEERVVADYPNDDYWRDLVARAQKAPDFSANEMRLDTFRALLATGAKLKPEETNNVGREALRRALSSEAQSILTQAGNATDPTLAKEVADAIKEETAGLAAEEKEVLAKGDGARLAGFGEVFLARGDNAKAIDFIQKGIAKGISDPTKADLAKLHLGIAQYRSGQKDAARTAWAEIKTNQAIGLLARNWTLISNKP